MAGLGAAERLGIKAFEEAGQVELRPNWTQDDAKAVMCAQWLSPKLIGKSFFTRTRKRG